MEILKREAQGVVLLDLAGEVDLYNAGALKETVREIIAVGKHRIIINMQNVPYIDSTGIGVMLSFLQPLRQQQGDLKLVSLSAAVTKVFQLTNLVKFFSIFDSEDAATAAFNLRQG